eukprot:5147383-Prymnesium_polylepis.1
MWQRIGARTLDAQLALTLAKKQQLTRFSFFQQHLKAHAKSYPNLQKKSKSVPPGPIRNPAHALSAVTKGRPECTTAAETASAA